jgi:transcriptional antiterminator
MTFQEIADTAGCSERTVRRTIKRIWPTLFTKGTPVINDPEMLRVLISALPKRNIVGQKSGQRSEPFKLPSGAQLREIRLMAEAGKLSAIQVQEILGVTIVKSLPPQSTEPFLPKEVTSRRLLELAEDLETGGARG